MEAHGVGIDLCKVRNSCEEISENRTKCRAVGGTAGGGGGAKVTRTIGELVEEAKRRTILFLLVIFTASYGMSLTSNSVLINVPIAVVVVALLRHIWLEMDVRLVRPSRSPPKPRYYHYKYIPAAATKDPVSSNWKQKVDSPVVEAAIDKLIQRLVAEWITNLWYSSLTPDQEAPQEIRALVNGVIGEIAVRAKQVNLINLLTSDVVNLVASHLELYREAQTFIGKELFGTLSSEERDEKLRLYLISVNKLHPGARSPQTEIQALQRLMGGVLGIVLKPEDAQCKILVCFARELLACAVMRPVMNFASPGFINQLVEVIVTSQQREEAKPERTTSAQTSRSGRTASRTGTVPGLELIDVGQGTEHEHEHEDVARRAPTAADGSRSYSGDGIPPSGNSGDWAHALDAFTQKKTEALAPEHLDNMWAKGRNYKKREVARAASENIAELEPLVIVEPIPEAGEMSELRSLKRPREDMLLGTTVNVDSDYYGRSQDRLIVVGEDSIGVHTGSRVIHHPLELPSEAPGNPEPRKEGHRHQRSRSTGGLEGLDNQERGSTSGNYDPMKKRTAATAAQSMYKAKLSCRVIGAHYEKTGSKSFAVYSISVADAEGKTWVVLRRFRNFEQLHRRLRDMPHYTLSLPPKRFLSSNLDNTFVRERCIRLNQYLQDLLSIPSIAELHEVWDFLSFKSQNYGFGENVSIMKTLAVNVDDAVEDVVRQFKGVSKKPSVSQFTDTGSGSSAIWNNSVHSQASEDDGEDDFQTGWHSDSEVHGVESRLGRGPMDSLSDGHSPVESLAGSEDEWIPPKLTVPLLNLVDVVFQLEGRGWIRRQVLWIAKQILQLGMGDAIDDWLLSSVQYLRREDVIASGIGWIEEILWPGGVFVTKQGNVMGATPSSQISFEEGLEAARRAAIVRELMQERAPTALVSLIGRRQYQRCAKDIYGFLQSNVCMKQLAFSLLEKLIAAAFPELEDVIAEVRRG